MFADELQMNTKWAPKVHYFQCQSVIKLAQFPEAGSWIGCITSSTFSPSCLSSGVLVTMDAKISSFVREATTTALSKRTLSLLMPQVLKQFWIVTNKVLKIKEKNSFKWTRHPHSSKIVHIYRCADSAEYEL